MQEFLIVFLGQDSIFAAFLSIFLSVVVSIIGVLPSAFITAANLIVFGLIEGLVVSIVGEALGAMVSFVLYRKGIKKYKTKEIQQPLLQKIKKLEGSNAFWIILGLRILPFIPSGVITLGSAFSKVSIVTFAIASTVGKIPSLIIEAGALYGFLLIDIKMQIGIIAVVICTILWKVIRNRTH